MPFAPRKLLPLAAALLLALALAFPLSRAQDVTIIVPDDGTAVLYSHDAAPEAVLALDPATAPEAVAMLLSSSSSVTMEADEQEAFEADEVEAALASAVNEAAEAEEDSAVAESTTEEESMVEATFSMLEAALVDAESESEAVAVAAQPAPEAALAADASSPSPAVAVVPTAQLVCPPTCPAGTRCRGNRGVCEPFSAFDCAGGKCAPSPVSSPPTPSPTTTPGVCKAKCNDVAPTPNWNCAQQQSFGACEQGWMIDGNYCQITCGRCPTECYDCNSMCLDKAPDGSGCAAQAGWGKCGETWMAGCMRSCGKCPAKCYSKASSSSSSSSSEFEFGGAEFTSFVSVSPSTRLPQKASPSKTAPSPSPSFELGPVSAPFGALSEVAAGPEGAPEVRVVMSSPEMAPAAATPAAVTEAEKEISDAEVSAALEQMMASTEGTSSAEVAFEA